eukprot:m51a1_g934 putative 5-oxoprolinase (1245) ;mRNA; f:238870-242752
MNDEGKWSFWIDRGGTFTDVVAREPSGALRTCKLLSSDPARYADAAVEAVRRLLRPLPVSPATVACVRMGTTVATNALLERRGDRTLLVATRGFRDALRVGYQSRPRLFDRRVALPDLLYSRVVEARERIDASGRVLAPIAADAERLAAEFRRAAADGYRTAAVVLAHGYAHGVHEEAAARMLRAAGFEHVTTSHEACPLMRLVSRGETTVVDAYLAPVLRRYVEGVASALPGVPLAFMQSSGGLARADAFRAKDAVLSGPAGGIVGMARAAAAAGHPRVIGFDMGGTSTDVSHFCAPQRAGAALSEGFERDYEALVAGVRVRAPMMSIHTVAAGGGSVLTFDGARMRVGPESAGARPGPACYRNGGPLTVTDANVMLGRVQAAHFPRVFGPAGDEPIDAATVRRQFAELAGRVGGGATAESVARGFVEVAVANMANAVKKISVSRGRDATRYALQCFGGAGGQHACAVAASLGMRTVLVHPLAGVLSAYGMGLADTSCTRQAAVEAVLGTAGAAARVLAALARASSEAAAQLGGAPAVVSSAHVRYEGTDTALPVALAGDDARADAVEAALATGFEAAHRQRFGFLMPARRVVVESVTAEAVLEGQRDCRAPRPERPHAPEPSERVRMYVGGAWADVPLHVRASLEPGALVEGPAVIAEDNATTVVDPGWRARVTGLCDLEITRCSSGSSERSGSLADAGVPEAVMLEVFNNAFMNIAEQMGVCLQNTAHSVNIKERLDFSCALFDARASLVANAPHMPVHLGSMGESVRCVAERNDARAMRRGDVYCLNDPYHGGTHLPDVTVVTPVWGPDVGAGDDAGVLFYVASRGHHAEIGGISPGSMPPFSKTIADEGVLLDNFKLVDGGVFREAELVQLLATPAGGAIPSRSPAQNVADLRAQVAANEKGIQELRAVVAQFGLATVQAYMQRVQDNAEDSVRRAIRRLPRSLAPDDGGEGYEVRMDNGSRVRVRVSLDRAAGSARVDFTGSSGQSPDNFNAPRAVTIAAVLYVFRTLVDDDIPLNAGCLRPIELVVPEGSILSPRPPAAVVAGNVEVSMCVTNALYGALGVLAGAQPTMNNFTFGDATRQYYETVAGGGGAGVLLDPATGDVCDGFDGSSVVQAHMTNSRLTDPEVLEWRYPVRLESFEIREGSGGRGRWHGGNVLTAEDEQVRFLEEMTAGILSNGRRVPAQGLAGGLPGAPGRCYVVRQATGETEELSNVASVKMHAGDLFVLETPGGGGFGAPQ